nr:pyruvate kinase [Actinoplanes digitatis]
MALPSPPWRRRTAQSGEPGALHVPAPPRSTRTAERPYGHRCHLTGDGRGQRSGESPRRPKRAGRAARRHRALEPRRDQQRPRRGRCDPENQFRRCLRAAAAQPTHQDHGDVRERSRGRPRARGLAGGRRHGCGLCEAAHVPVIWATQVLETLAKTGQPSRAEITDAAAGERAECVMLNKGPYIVEAIRTLDDILARMDEVQTKSRTLMRHIHSWDAQ